MKYLNALNTISGLGAKKMKLLMSFFGEGEKIWTASYNDLLGSGIGESLSQKIVTLRTTIDINKEWEKLTENNICMITMHDALYPPLLQHIPDNPYILYLKGDIHCLNFPLVAIVGSRKLTEYGNRATHGFARDLAKNGICVVSGLAFGVDCAAHLGALEAKGKTIAILGNSLDDASIAPRTNLQLAHTIIRSGGLLISEFPVKTSASTGTFPARNRIMAGMSLGTLVIEAAEKSGSLITANLALDYNRDVFAVPGSIFSPQSIGTHLLIKNGAKLVTCAHDIVTELRLEVAPDPIIQKQSITLSENESAILAVLSQESMHIDRIAKITKLETSTISSLIAIMEIKGLLKNIGGQNYIRL